MNLLKNSYSYNDIAKLFNTNKVLYIHFNNVFIYLCHNENYAFV